MAFRPSRYLPILEWGRDYRRETLVNDLIAAVIVGKSVDRPAQKLTISEPKIGSLDRSKFGDLPRNWIKELDDQASAFNTMLTGLRSFETYVPKTLVNRLMKKDGGSAVQSEERNLTVMFTDIVSFTSMSEGQSAKDVDDMVNDHLAILGRCVENEGGTIDKFIGAPGRVNYTIIGDPANGSVLQAAHRLVVLAIIVRFRAGIQMDHFGACGCAGERHHAGIAEQVQRLDRAARRANLFLRELPMDRMFLEHAHMPEGGAAGLESQAVPLHRPAVERLGGEHVPIAGAVILLRLGGKPRIGAPALDRAGRFPEGLRVGPDHGLAAEAFELLEVATVEQGVIIPIIGNQEAGLGLHYLKSLWRHAS